MLTSIKTSIITCVTVPYHRDKSKYRKSPGKGPQIRKVGQKIADTMAQ